MPLLEFFFPKFSGTIYEILSAPISPFEITSGFVFAAATKSIIVGLIILITSSFFRNFNCSSSMDDYLTNTN